MSWQLVKEYVDALPDNLEVIFNEDGGVKVRVKSDTEPNTELNVKPAFNNLWKRLSGDTQDFRDYVRGLLAGKTSELSTQINNLAEILSVKMNGIQLKVNIAQSLTTLLSKVFSASAADDNCAGENTDSSDAETVTSHQLSVVVQIPDFNTPPSDSEQLQKDLSQLCIDSLPLIRYDGRRKQGHFSAKVETMIKEFSETLFDDEVTDAQVLVALAIVLKSYPEKWQQAGFFWDAWLAVTLQLCSLPPDNNVIFPCMWIKQLFETERYLDNPGEVKVLLFGMDPVSDTENYGLQRLCQATGVAFHAVGNDNPSIKGMKTHYGLDCDDDNPIAYCQKGLMMVNMIRCIGECDDSLTNNSCYRAWIAYTLRIIHYFSSCPRSKPVLVLTASWSALTKMYIPRVCEGQYVQTSHPSVREISERYQDEQAIVQNYLSKFKPT